MNSLYGKWYDDFRSALGEFGDDELFASLDSLLHASKNTFAFNRKLLEKAIDVSWVEAIENGLIHVDNVLRNPSRTIEDVEEIVSIERSRKITVESVKHLAQHTDMIQSIDKRTGKITPSKILNVHKEESLFTYENKFINTLVDRLYIFINTRYEKLAQVARDEEVFTLGFDTTIDDGAGGKMKIQLNIETSETLDSVDANGYTIWQRVEKLKKIIEGYKGSELCMTLGNTYIRPPVMRTNAIMKNVELKACLTLWQYILGYDKVGYQINIENTAVKPEPEYIEDFYKLIVMNLMLFRSYTDYNGYDMEELKTQRSKSIAPRFLKHFEKEITNDYGIQTEAAVGYIAADGEFKLTKKLPANMTQVFDQIGEVIKIEKAYLAEREAERLKLLKAEEEAERVRREEERKLEEQRRIEEAKREERERIRREQEEEQRRIQELIEQKKREQEEEERERARLEAERQAKLEEQRRLEEEARLKREEEERAAAERERIILNKSKMRSELGEAEGMDQEKLTEEDSDELEKKAYEEVTEAEIEEAKAALEEEMAEKAEEGEEVPEEIEDPRAVAARMKLEQQKREKERRETERAQRLKAERKRIESKPFEEIRWEYSKNPIRLLQKLFQYILVYWFHIIPEDTDNPDYKKLREELEAKKQQKLHEAEERDAMEVYYRKYAGTFKYRFRRMLEDRKFKKRKKQQAKGRPKPTYTPPQRTPEQQREIDLEMKRLYREYHVTWVEKLRRKRQERKRQRDLLREALGQKKTESDGGSEEGSAVKPAKGIVRRIFDVLIAVLIVAMIGLCAYVMISAARGKAADFFGKRMLKVVTGSMEPSIHTGDYIIVEETDTDDLKEGDIISFYSDQDDVYGELVTHRIIEIKDDGTFVTKGDANPVDDKVQADPDKVVGKYVGKSRFFIWLSTFGDPRKLLMLLVIIIVAIGALFEVRSVAKIGKEAFEEKRRENEEEHEKMMREAIEKEKLRLAEQEFGQKEVKTGESREDNET